jgi:allophanate hydrolase
MPARNFGSFVNLIPAPLGIGSITLEDGVREMGFICEPQGLKGATEITSFGGWKKWRASLR